MTLMINDCNQKDFDETLDWIRESRPHLYQIFNMPTSVAERETVYKGNCIYVISGSILVRFNENTNDQIPLTAGQWLKTPFFRVFIIPTNASVLLGTSFQFPDFNTTPCLYVPPPIYVQPATTPVIYNVPCALAGTTYIQALPAACKKITVKSQDGTTFQLNYSGNIPVNPYITVPANDVYYEDLIGGTNTIYFEFSVANKNIEIIAWS